MSADSDKRLAIALLIQRAGDADLAAIHDLLMARAALKQGMDAVVRVLKHGAAKHNGGQFGSAPGWTASQHAEHAHDHAVSAAIAPESRDAETGELDAAHGAARLVLTAQLVESVERGQVW